MSLASAAPSRRRTHVRAGALRSKAAANPISTNRHRDVRVPQAAFRASLIGFEENARVRLPRSGTVFLAQEGQQLRAFWRREADAIFD